MKKPKIIYCNVIRKDKKQGQVAIKGRHIESMIDALIEAREQMLEYFHQEHLAKHNEAFIKIEQALKKAGVQL